MFCFINLTPQTPPSVIHGWKATDLLYEMVKTKKIFFHPVKRQIFGDAPKQTFYMISKLVLLTLYQLLLNIFWCWLILYWLLLTLYWRLLTLYWLLLSTLRESRFSRILENFFPISLLDLDLGAFSFHFSLSISISRHFTFHSLNEWK